MKRAPLKRGDKPMARSAINPVSAKRITKNRERRAMMEETFGPRDRWTCSIAGTFLERGIMGPCYGPINGHEIVKRSQGGSITDPSNILLLCSRHNDWVEAFPTEAHRLGLMKHNWEG